MRLGTSATGKVCAPRVILTSRLGPARSNGAGSAWAAIATVAANSGQPLLRTFRKLCRSFETPCASDRSGLYDLTVLLLLLQSLARRLCLIMSHRCRV